METSLHQKEDEKKEIIDVANERISLQQTEILDFQDQLKDCTEYSEQLV